MLSLVLSELVLICIFLEETYFCYLHAYLLACFYEIHLRFLTSHIYFHLDDCDKPYQSSTREMDDGADKRFRNSRAARNPSRFAKCFIMPYQISYIETGEKRAFFLQSFNLPKCIFVGLLTVEGLCSLLFK